MKITCNSPTCPKHPPAAPAAPVPAPPGDQVELGGHHAPPPGGHMGVHGMLMFGKNYLSHIPMFHVPHDYQILMDVRFEHPQLPPEANFGGKLHTFVPDRFSLGDLLNGKLEQIQGTVYEGNFEKEGKPLLEGVKAHIEEILHSHHLDAGSQGPEKLEYLLYGERQDAYLVHPIEGNAGFDQLLSVDCSRLNISDEELARGVKISVPDRPNTVEGRLVPDHGSAIRAVEQGDGDLVELKVKQELSILVGPYFTDGP